MLKYIARRVLISILVLWAASVLIYVLTINSGDPLAGLRESPDPAMLQLIENKTIWMGLDLPWYERYWNWLSGVGGCFTGNCDFGLTSTGSQVSHELGVAAVTTLRLVTIATFVAIFIGITVGIMSALRQYSGFDYAVTFMAFLFFSLPVFWAAVLLKEFGAIRFNRWLNDPAIATTTILLIGFVLALLVQFILGGSLKRRLITAGVTAGFVWGTLFYFENSGWFHDPSMGIAVITIASLGAAVLLVMLFTGLGHRRMLYSTLTTVGVGVIAYFIFRDYLAEPSTLGLVGLFGLALLSGAVSGWFWGGFSRKTAIGLSMVTATVMSLLVVAEQLVAHWVGYNSGLGRRPAIGTIGDRTPGFDGSFWEVALDRGTQLILPTTVLVLLSIASYSRYTRASMLEVMGQDYVRTARSKGLSERTVIVKHAFRNALIPITTIIAFDFAGLISGAIITENVFGWKGMGLLFRDGLMNVDPNPVMAFFLVTGGAAIIMNLIADLLYAVLDPRIRR